jgi:hypothetical protein
MTEDATPEETLRTFLRPNCVFSEFQLYADTGLAYDAPIHVFVDNPTGTYELKRVFESDCERGFYFDPDTGFGHICTETCAELDQVPGTTMAATVDCSTD